MTKSRPIQDTDIVSRMETIVAADMDGEMIMMSVETGQYFHFDDIATDIWRGLAKPQQIEEIVTRLRETYDAWIRSAVSRYVLALTREVPGLS